MITQLSTNGLLSFGQGNSFHIPTTSSGHLIIAPFWADFNFASTSGGGTIYYRVTNDTSTLDLIAGYIHDGNEELNDYVPTQAVIVTWFRSHAYEDLFPMVKD